MYLFRSIAVKIFSYSVQTVVEKHLKHSFQVRTGGLISRSVSL